MVTVDTNNPGPGAYDKVLPKIIHHTFNKGKKARFGSGMERYNPSLLQEHKNNEPVNLPSAASGRPVFKRTESDCINSKKNT